MQYNQRAANRMVTMHGMGSTTASQILNALPIAPQNDSKPRVSHIHHTTMA
jgi:hypothetical protein